MNPLDPKQHKNGFVKTAWFYSTLARAMERYEELFQEKKEKSQNTFDSS